MRRLLSILLAICMCLSIVPIGAMAADITDEGLPDAPESSAAPDVPDTSEPSEPSGTPDAPDVPNAPETVANSLTINMYQSWHTGTEFNVSVDLENGDTREGVIKEDAARIATTTSTGVVFDDIPNGTHQVTISAPYHLDFVQDVTFDNSNVILNVTNNHALNDAQKFGVIPAGDLNQDGVIDDEDAELVLDSDVDFTGDGVTDNNSQVLWRPLW